MADAVATRTLLFTDIEGSTQLLQRLGQAYVQLLEDHHRLLRRVFHSYGGVEAGIEGDAFFVVFPDSDCAIRAATEAQISLAAYRGPSGATLRVRMAIHVGEATNTSIGYVGLGLHQAARMCAAAHGAQVLASAEAIDRVSNLPPEITLRDLGRRRLKDLGHPIQLFQLCHPLLQQDFPDLRTLDLVSNNLPAQSTSFVGRNDEITDLVATLGRRRIVTVIGPGGVGKTRLALHTTGEILELFPDGILLIELATIDEPDAVLPTLGAALRLRDRGADAPLLPAVVDALERRRVLLIIDNCEHVGGAVASVAETLLARLPLLRILTTSRARLGVRGEVLFDLTALPAPPRRVTFSTTQLAKFPAVRLFCERAADVSQRFKLTSHNAAAVGEICSRLDGLPLAIELAAARVHALSPSEILSNLDVEIDLPGDGTERQYAHQQSLTATLEWSYRLLSTPSRSLFERLSVLPDVFTLEAASAVSAEQDSGSTARNLATLVDRSLVATAEASSHARYRMLSVVRDFACARLREHGYEDSVHAQLASWVASRLDRSQFVGEDQAERLEYWNANYSIVRTVLLWLEKRPSTSVELLTVAAALGPFWLVRGSYSEGARWLELACREGAKDELRAWATLDLAHIRQHEGNPQAAIELARTALSVFAQKECVEGQVAALADLGLFSQHGGEIAAAEGFYSRALDLADHEYAAASLAKAQLHAAMLAHDKGEYDVALARNRAAVALFRRLGDERGIAMALGNLGLVAHDQGQLAEAESLYQDALERFSRLGDKIGLALAMMNLGQVSYLRGAFTDAERLQEEGLAIARSVGDLRAQAEGLAGLAMVAADTNDPARARDLMVCALSAARDTREERSCVTYLEESARILCASNRFASAAKILIANERARDSSGVVLPPLFDSRKYAAWGDIEAHIGRDEIEAERLRPGPHDLAGAIDLALTELSL